MNQEPWNDFKTVSRLIANIKSQESYDTYCGRPGPWGNPIEIKEGATRSQAVEQHQRWLNNLINETSVTYYELAMLTHAPDGSPRTVGCFCTPLLCHCHTLVRYSLAAWQGPEALATAMRQRTTSWYRDNVHLAVRRPIGQDGYEVTFAGASTTDKPPR